MVSLNKVFLMGNLTRDPELRYTSSGSSLANFGLAVNRKFRQGEELKEEVCFIDVVVWGKQAESCSEYLSKGRSVFIEGRLHYRTWETDDGQKRSKVEVVANSVQFLPRSTNQTATETDLPEDQTTMPEEQPGQKKSPSGDIPF